MTSLTKSELLDLIRTEKCNLNAVLDDVGAERATAAGATGEWAAKDVVSHLAHWVGVTANEMAMVARGETPPAVDFERIHITNAEVQAADQARSYDELRAALNRAADALAANVTALDDSVLAQPCTWANEESIAMQAASEMFHWRGHIQKLRQWLDANAT